MAPSNNRRKKWSFAYSKFVKDPNADILEIIAYALYKRDKAMWVEGQCALDKEPTGPETIKWSENNSTKEKVEDYKKSARNILCSFESRIELMITPGLRDEVTAQLRAEIPGMNAVKVVKIERDLQELIDQTKAGRTFWASFKVGVAASFFYSLGLAGLYLIFWSLGFPLPAPPLVDSRPSEPRVQSSEVLDKIPQKTARPR